MKNTQADAAELEGTAKRRRGVRSPDARQSPEALAGIIEGEIIPRLLLAHKLGPPIPSGCEGVLGLSDFDVDGFCAILLSSDLSAVLQHTVWLARRGASLESIFLNLLGPAARRLGEYWEQDVCSFSDVTIGLSRLQQAVHELASSIGVLARPEPATSAPRALLTAAPGEQHTLGLVILEELLARDGWHVRAEPTITHVELMAILRRSHFDLAGLTVSCDALLDQIPELISCMRASSMNRRMQVLLGGLPFVQNPDLALRLGADATASDAREALGLAKVIIAQAAPA